jgi:glyceraldehyde-3-phosphate dehydrogenase (NADP+)
MDLTPMLIGGSWRTAITGITEDVTSPYDGSVVGMVPVAGPDDVEAACRQPTRQRFAGVAPRPRADADPAACSNARRRASRCDRGHHQPEVGKTITEATGEASRSGRSFGWRRSRAPSCTATRFRSMRTGEPVRTRSASHFGSRAALWSRFHPSTTRRCWCCTSSLRRWRRAMLWFSPARTTPLTALALAACFVDAGLPEGVLVLTGPGASWATCWSRIRGCAKSRSPLHGHR